MRPPALRCDDVAVVDSRAAPRRAGRQRQRVAPHLLGQRLGAFLQPSIVGVSVRPTAPDQAQRRARAATGCRAGRASSRPSAIAETGLNARIRQQRRRAARLRHQVSKSPARGGVPGLAHQIVGRWRQRAADHGRGRRARYAYRRAAGSAAARCWPCRRRAQVRPAFQRVR